MTAPFSARQSAGFTFHWSAAAWTSIVRAWAPTVRSWSKEFETLEEPPVICMPKAVCANSGAAGASSARTFDQSHSSSSATIIGSDVVTPCPNSRCFTMTVQVPSLPMRRNAFGCTGFFASWAKARPRSCGSQKPMTNPPAIAAEDWRKRRREALFTLRAMVAPRLSWARGGFVPSAAEALLIASRMRWYVPQRQMLPLIAASMSASLGRGFFASSAVADMICPDWQ
jgi:hypothetical protein